VSFRDFVARKTAEALRATLPPYRTDFEGPANDVVSIGSDWTRRLFDGPFYMSRIPDSRPACNVTFVQSFDGNTAAHDPGALGGGETDKHVIYEGLTRVAVDAVMAGAETARSGDRVFSVWHPELVTLRTALGKLRHPIQVVATLRGFDLDHKLLFNTPELSVILITVSRDTRFREAVARRPWISVILLEHPADFPAAFERLRARGIERLSCIGGRHIAAQLIDARLVDDLYLTTSPEAGGEPNTPIYPGPLPIRAEIVRKHGTGAENGVVFRHSLLSSAVSEWPRHTGDTSSMRHTGPPV
jgi:riboflavin biosynthesis pyrimidine reductase